MISRENAMREALTELETQRAKNLMIERERREYVTQKSPVIRTLLEKRQTIFSSGMRRAFSEPKNAQQISDVMRREMEKVNRSIRDELVKMELAEDYLQPVYRCAICKDTGYFGEPVHEQCSCLKGAVLAKLYRDDGLQSLEKENFSTFDENVFPDNLFQDDKGFSSQRAFILRCKKFCENYANAFQPRESKGILMYGESGLGKTFLMNCVAQRVLERGFSVVIISAYNLIETMRKNQFDGTREENVQDIISCDLLCIDDLGSEPMIKGVTLSAIYHIINERRIAGRPIIITTNLNGDQLMERYDDRTRARLQDSNAMRIIKFIGSDVRRFRRQ